MMVHSAVTLHARLREATRPAHARLEASVKLLDQRATKTRIARLLGRFHGFHASWEPALAGVVPDHLLHARLKLPLLERDLRSLGAGDDLVKGLPTCVKAGALCRCEASAAGSLYVLEGSTLGGRVITELLSEEPWYPPHGLAYWNSYGVDTGSRWKETLGYLESLPGARSGEIVAAAQATFELLQSWLQPACPAEENRG